MALSSDLLSGNKRLQQCSELDNFHVVPNEPASEHVKLIQEALRQVDQAIIPAGETNYGTATTKAVVNFKTKKNLFTRGTKTIDPIVGTGTIAKLDEGMRKIEDEKKRKNPIKPPKIVPKLALSGQCQLIGELKDNLLADDMKFGDPLTARKSVATAAITAPFVFLSDDTLETTMKTAMFTAVNIAAGTSASLAVRGQALALCDHFFRGGGTQRDFKKASDVACQDRCRVLGFCQQGPFRAGPRGPCGCENGADRRPRHRRRASARSWTRRALAPVSSPARSPRSSVGFRDTTWRCAV